MALLRRRIRDPHLTMEGHKAGSRSHTDVVLCYLDDKADPEILKQIRRKLSGHRGPVTDHGTRDQW